MSEKLKPIDFYVGSLFTDYDQIDDMVKRWKLIEKNGYPFTRDGINMFVSEVWEAAINSMFTHMEETGIDRDAVMADKEEYIKQIIG